MSRDSSKEKKINYHDYITACNIAKFYNWYSYDTAMETCSPYYTNDYTLDILTPTELESFVNSEDALVKKLDYSKLSKDAQSIISFILYTSDEELKRLRIASPVRGCITYGKVRKYFHEKFGIYRARMAMREIKIFLKKSKI
ncbi:MAG: hypothetical protein ACXACY_30010 [Candidatus Hodarchaeales archaeon]|jgi:hypothetical protein